MSQENVEIVRAVYDAVAARDSATVLAFSSSRPRMPLDAMERRRRRAAFRQPPRSTLPILRRRVLAIRRGVAPARPGDTG